MGLKGIAAVTLFLTGVFLAGCNQQPLISEQNEPKSSGSQSSQSAPLVTSSSTPAEPKNPKLELHAVELSSQQVDLYGDGEQHEVALISYTDDKGNPYLWQVKLDDQLKASLAQPEESLFAPADMKIEDLNGDGKPEILVYRYNTGSGGGIGLHIYSPLQGWDPIFSVENPFAPSSMEGKERYSVKYIGEYKVSFEDDVTGMKTMIPLDAHKYEGIDIPLEKIGTWVDSISAYYFSDKEDAGGAKTIVAEQRIIGVTHPDTIAKLRTTYHWNGTIYVPTTVGLYDEQDNLLQTQAFES
ncbi:hypothetical protein ACFQZT_11525 [Paenibacillus sp. GCM10027628]|uniref:hypothetical protein n=1 Tax=Paenibacillus sp. GCM10027628 TaxID=3273413 RepID=UPI00363492CE